MKRAIVLAAMLAFSAVPAFAQTQDASTRAQRDECLLISKGCANEVDSIQKKMRKLQAEIRKGTKVYTPEELKVLEVKLKEVNELLEHTLRPGH